MDNSLFKAATGLSSFKPSTLALGCKQKEHPGEG
jgi:hypothetical protein